MTFLTLRPNVSYTVVNMRPVFLDLARDRYFALDPASAAAFEHLEADAGRVDPASPQARRLLATGLFRRSEVPSPIDPVSAAVPRRSIFDEARGSGRAAIPALLGVRRATRQAVRALASTPLLQILDRARAGRQPGPAGTSEALVSRAAQFRAARAMLPTTPVCLPDSIALLDWLAQRSHFPQLVFGVKLDPFGAHCWVQTDALILNDAADTVAEFAPILVVE